MTGVLGKSEFVRLRRRGCIHGPAKSHPIPRRPREESPGHGRAQGHKACPLCPISPRRGHVSWVMQTRSWSARSPLSLVRPWSGGGCALPTSVRRVSSPHTLVPRCWQGTGCVLSFSGLHPGLCTSQACLSFFPSLQWDRMASGGWHRVASPLLWSVMLC